MYLLWNVRHLAPDLPTRYCSKERRIICSVVDNEERRIICMTLSLGFICLAARLAR